MSKYNDRAVPVVKQVRDEGERHDMSDWPDWKVWRFGVDWQKTFDADPVTRRVES